MTPSDRMGVRDLPPMGRTLIPVSVVLLCVGAFEYARWLADGTGFLQWTWGADAGSFWTANPIVSLMLYATGLACSRGLRAVARERALTSCWCFVSRSGARLVLIAATIQAPVGVFSALQLMEQLARGATAVVSSDVARWWTPLGLYANVTWLVFVAFNLPRLTVPIDVQAVTEVIRRHDTSEPVMRSRE